MEIDFSFFFFCGWNGGGRERGGGLVFFKGRVVWGWGAFFVGNIYNTKQCIHIHTQG